MLFSLATGLERHDILLGRGTAGHATTQRDARRGDLVLPRLCARREVGPTRDLRRIVSGQLHELRQRGRCTLQAHRIRLEKHVAPRHEEATVAGFHVHQRGQRIAGHGDDLMGVIGPLHRVPARDGGAEGDHGLHGEEREHHAEGREQLGAELPILYALHERRSRRV